MEMEKEKEKESRRRIIEYSFYCNYAFADDVGREDIAISTLWSL